MRSRTATYHASTRIVQLVLLLLVHRDEGIEVAALPEELGCSLRTVERYLRVLADRVWDPTATSQTDPLLEYGYVTGRNWEAVDDGDWSFLRRGRRVRIGGAVAERLVAALTAPRARRAA